VGESIPARAYVDTGPILERELGLRAGLGWFGRNTMLIHPRKGSYFFLGALLLGTELEPDSSFDRDHCGSCRACLDACPTGALLGRDETGAPLMDARTCISYLTIEHHGPIPRELRPALGNRIYGCDICQEVCPWNRGVEKRRDGLVPAPDATPVVSLRGWLERDGEELTAELDRLYVPRNDARWLRRNALVAAGNVGDTEVVPLVERHAQGDDPVLRDAAEWALGRLAERVA
jgi:epoxyqueuosine reductase